MTDRLTTVSLFSGCGGSDLGAHRAGATIVYASDIRQDSITTYTANRHLFDVDSNDVHCQDVTDITALPAADLIIGCYPCQSFSMGGPRRPESDHRTKLFREFIRCINLLNPKFIVAENVAGLAWLRGGQYLQEQTAAFQEAGAGYHISWKLLNAKDYGIPADRRRVFIIGCRTDLGIRYDFPEPTHGDGLHQVPWVAHGPLIAHLPIEPVGDYYDYTKEPFSWWYLSRNRKRPWTAPSYAISGNWRHLPLHPASPTMRLVSSDLEHGSRQRWEFTKGYDDEGVQPPPPRLESPRRLSWRECAILQTFPSDFVPHGTVESKLWQIGNAVPPTLMEAIMRPLITEEALSPR